MRFSKLQEEVFGGDSDESSRTSLTSTNVVFIGKPKSWNIRSILKWLSIFVSVMLVMSFIIDSKVTSDGLKAQINALNIKIHNSSTKEGRIIGELKMIGNKTNLNEANFAHLKTAQDNLKETSPWTQAKNELKALMDEKESSLRGLVSNLNSTMLSSSNLTRSWLQKVENVSLSRGTQLEEKMKLVRKHSEEQDVFIHHRLNLVSFSAANLSSVLESHKDNLGLQLEGIKFVQDSLQQELEAMQINEELTNEIQFEKIDELENALNVTLISLNETKSIHLDQLKRTLDILLKVVKAKNETDNADNELKPDAEADSKVDALDEAGSNSTAAPDHTCDKITKVKPNEIVCKASSELARKRNCKKAFDGLLAIGKPGVSAWASKGEGRGAWIQATFSRQVIVKQLKVLQRHSPTEANKVVEMEMDNGVKQTATLIAKGDRHWNIIKLSRGVPTRNLKLTVLSVYRSVNNGFKEIEIYGC